MAMPERMVEALVPSLGTHCFSVRFLEVMHSFAGVDYYTLFDYSAHLDSPRTILAVGESVSANDRSYLNEIYSTKLFRLDPLYQLSRRSRDAAGPFACRIRRSDVTDPYYRKEVYDRGNFLEKASILIPTSDSFYCLNLYRSHNSGDYEQRAYQSIRRSAPLIASLVQKHIDMHDGETVRFDLQHVSRRLTNLCRKRLTRREIEVCARIVCGYSSVAIALDLGISVNTVYAHRRHAYYKLGIGTQNQLFGIVYENRLNLQ